VLRCNLVRNDNEDAATMGTTAPSAGNKLRARLTDPRGTERGAGGRRAGTERRAAVS